jgi:hypothetical protein
MLAARSCDRFTFIAAGHLTALCGDTQIRLSQDPAIQDYTAPPEGEMNNDAGTGGDYVQDPALQDYTAPPEGEVGSDVGTDGDYVPQ